MAHCPVPVSAAHRSFNQKGQKRNRRSCGDSKVRRDGRAWRRTWWKTAVRATQRAVVLERILPLHARQG
eukprot:1050465-Pleurochrysis_carterae.AAC.3